MIEGSDGIGFKTINFTRSELLVKYVCIHVLYIIKHEKKVVVFYII